MKKTKLVFDLQRFAADASAGLAATGTKLEMSTDGTKFDVLGGVKTVPDMGADPENIDVTDLSDDKKKSIPGIENTATLAFTFVYKGSNFATVLEHNGDNKQYHWKVTYPDGMTATFVGSYTVKIGNLAVNGALEYTVSIILSDGPNFTAAEAVSAGA
ncbi:phage tail protein [Lactobacillus sp. CBA3605]|uniref:phage tail tube protein n=1 Tax=Lactobacillus sp. CBA3605 TaxID=2099788 RepID=UPI000CFB005B|nr:phage tail tube protein [Lactobacillus sp. CBA3605]AVK60530.1 phage tail protein [Lactobacillus sp. CBA3605]